MKETTLSALAMVCQDFARVTSLIRQETDEVIAKGDHVDIIRHFNHTRIAVEDVKVAREALNDMADHLSKTVIPDVVATLKERTGQKPPFNIEGVGRVTVSHRFSCTIIDKETGYQWLRDTGNGSLITETVNSSTLSAFAKNKLEQEGVELPPDVFKVGTMPYTSITKV